jgi:hypothetical protein
MKILPSIIEDANYRAYVTQILEARMQDFDWKHISYDPLEANTEAETLDDRNVFIQLEEFLGQLQKVYAFNEQGKQIVEALTDKYWKGHPMESQKADLFKPYSQSRNNTQVQEPSHPISNEVLDLVQVALLKGENWMAYNGSLYFIGKEDVHFFDNEYDAHDFAVRNVSDRDNFQVIPITSVADVLKRIPYGQELHEQLAPYLHPSIERTDPERNPLYDKDGNAFTDALIEHLEQPQIINYKTNVMNTENLEFLADRIKYAGFGDKQLEALEGHLKEGKEAFQMVYTAEINKKNFEATLNFRKSDSTDRYFFNGYTANLERKNGEKVQQYFYLDNGKGVKAKEAYNLLEGRAVYKDLTNKAGEPYKAWIQLDFDNKDKHNNFEVKQFHENFGYNLKEGVSKYAVADLDGGEKEKALMQSLQKGNIQSVTIEKDGNTNKMFIEANPQFKTVNLYDGHMKRVLKEGLEQYLSAGKSQGQEKELKQEVKQDAARDAKQKAAKEIKTPKQNTSRSKSKSVSH